MGIQWDHDQALLASSSCHHFFLFLLLLLLLPRLLFTVTCSFQRRFSSSEFRPCIQKYRENGMIRHPSFFLFLYFLIFILILTDVFRETLSGETRTAISHDLLKRLQAICADPRAQKQRALTTVSARMCSCVAAAVPPPPSIISLLPPTASFILIEFREYA